MERLSYLLVLAVVVCGIHAASIEKRQQHHHPGRCTQNHGCQNGATCVDTAHGHMCACATGFVGPHCQFSAANSSRSVAKRQHDHNDHGHHQGPCTPDHGCQNGGSCVDTEQGHMCECPTGFLGPHCQIVALPVKRQDHGHHGHTCANSNACQNGGTCVDTTTGYFCQCHHGFTGLHCELSIHGKRDVAKRQNNHTDHGHHEGRCTQNHGCRNGATCVDTAHGHMCACAPGYVGGHCQFSVNITRSVAKRQNDHGHNPGACAHSHSCHNGGTCVDTEHGHTCTCPDGFTGAHCQTDVVGKRDVAKRQNDHGHHPGGCAHSHSCQNGGTCVDTEHGHTCACPDGFTGAHCQTDVVGKRQVAKRQNDHGHHPGGCAHSHSCQNGGTCVDTEHGHTCACPDGFTGAHCQTDVVGKRQVHGHRSCEHSHTCHNGGTCVEAEHGHTCICPEGFGGNHCNSVVEGTTQPPVMTTMQPPMNNTNSTANNSSVKAMPVKRQDHGHGHEGHHCSQDHGCQNGGTCVDTVSGHFCSCPDGFTGVHCQLDVIGKRQAAPVKRQGHDHEHATGKRSN